MPASPSSRASVSNGVALPPSQLVAQQLVQPSTAGGGGAFVDEEHMAAQAEVEATRRALGDTVDECVALFLGQV